MSFETDLWREASLAAGVEWFFERVGRLILEELALSKASILHFDGKRSTMETLAIVERGSLGVTRVERQLNTMKGDALESVQNWLHSGQILPSGRSSASIARELMKGLHSVGAREWTFAPLLVGAQPIGVLAVVPMGNAAPDASNLAVLQEASTSVLANELARRELSRLREAAEAAKSAALARLHVREIDPTIVGAEAGLREVMSQVETVAHTDATVLIFGETGSGKEVVARAIHERSRRAKGPVHRVNCGAISPGLIDSELFGHERGSFTGAVSQRAGWFEKADGGTLFLDEIGELPLEAQVRLLRVLQDGVFERVGGTRSLRVDVRVIAATHRDLPALVRSGAFREDLWYRLSIVSIRLPSLRERLDDIGALALHFAARAGRRYGAGPLPISEADIALLRTYDWPGNVRELAAVIERAVILGEGKRLDVARALGTMNASAPAAEPTLAESSSHSISTLEEATRKHIELALRECNGRIEGPNGAARVLDINPNTLRSKMRKLKILGREFRANLR